MSVCGVWVWISMWLGEKVQTVWYLMRLQIEEKRRIQRENKSHSKYFYCNSVRSDSKTSKTIIHEHASFDFRFQCTVFMYFLYTVFFSSSSGIVWSRVARLLYCAVLCNKCSETVVCLFILRMLMKYVIWIKQHARPPNILQISSPSVADIILIPDCF